MKELSIEDKAKRYDEAIKYGQYLINERCKEGTNGSFHRADLDKMFPELAESEDERIRKELIQRIKYDGNGQYDYNKEDYIAWLEKQEQHIKFIDSIQIGDKVTRNRDGVLVNLSQLNRVAKSAEKQDEQKHKIQPKFKIGDTIRFKGNETLKGEAEAHKIVGYDNELYVFADGTTDLFCEQDLYELVEQKPTDKVEPKFHEGDWIIKDNYSAQQVKEADKDSYTLDGSISGIETLPKKYIEKNYHLWTIQDAKDGDVLCSGQIILLFKKWEEDNDWNFVIAYAGIDISGKLQITNGHWLISNSTQPATKEQCDLLFQKIKESGYEWDGKELKKIEQKPAWSKEDEEIIEALISLCDEAKDNIPQLSALKNWFKSLKERVQPKQEWSEEDEIICKAIIDNIKAICKEGYFFGNIGSDKLIDWLEFLKYRLQWKPSDEQIEALEHFIVYHNGSTNYAKDLEELRLQLKKLKE